MVASEVTVDPLFSQVIINDAYAEPTRHLNLARRTAGESEILPGRRPAGYYDGGRAGADAPITERRWQELAGVNKIRERVRKWRTGTAPYAGVTNETRKLLEWWNRTDRPGIHLFFCQREAVETIIWLVEAPESERAGLSDIEAPDPFTRYCCKMATGAGKTTAMAMLAAWSVINKVTHRQDARFSDAVLVVCPNLTVKERLQVLYPSHPQNDYDGKALLPPGTDFKERLAQGRFQVSNWHQLAALTAIPNAIRFRKQEDQPVPEESDSAFCRRVLREIGDKHNVLVFNDEAHHAYRTKEGIEGADDDEEEFLETEDLQEFVEEATVWVRGLDRVHRDRSIRLCVDVSATPCYIARSGYPDGTPFSWIVSDFGLVDAVESGIVKVPRVPKKDDSGDSEPRYLHLWERIRDHMPRRAIDGDARDLPLTKILMESEGALRSLAHLYRRTFQEWRGRSHVPPCMIVVCNNTRTAELMANFIAGGEVGDEFQGEDRTLRIDSALLRQAEGEGGDARAQLLRRKVATVGKPGTPEESPGGQLRCVVSVAMLSEGWDARNVTQILGLRAFSSQLLCEQVIGRGLRRASYEDLSEPEFVDIYGVPFQLLPVQQRAPGGTHKPATIVRALPERLDLEITFPRVVGFFMDVGTELDVDDSKLEPMELTRQTEPGRVEIGHGSSYYGGAQAEGLSHAAEPVDADDVYRLERVQTTAYRIAHEIVAGLPEQHRPYLFRRVLEVVRRYVETRVRANGLPLEMIALRKYRDVITSRVRQAITTRTGQPVQLPIYDSIQPVGSTREVSFTTRRPTYETKRSHISHVPCDAAHRDVAPEKLWEFRVAQQLDEHDAVRCFAKNDHVDFTIPYTFRGDASRYVPDFLVSLTNGTTLILEVKGEEDERDREKYTTARTWVDAINRDGKHGRWAFEVVKDPNAVAAVLKKVLAT